MEKLLNDYKICFTKGDTYALAVKMKNISSDLSTAVFTVKENADDSPLIQKTLGAGVSKIDDRSYKNEKTYKIQIQSEDTVSLEPLVQYLYDFRIKMGNVVQTLLSGVFVVQHNISQVSTTSTSTISVQVADVIESDVSTTAATKGIEYESDPVALAKIGNMSTLTTTQKGTVVKAINEVNAPTFGAAGSRSNVNSGEKQSTLWAKVKRWFGDLKALAFKDKVSTADINDSAVTSAKIGTGAVTAAKISSGAVTTEKFAADAKCPKAGVADSVVNATTDFTNAEWVTPVFNSGTKDMPRSQFENGGVYLFRMRLDWSTPNTGVICEHLLMTFESGYVNSGSVFISALYRDSVLKIRYFNLSNEIVADTIRFRLLTTSISSGGTTTSSENPDKYTIEYKRIR